MPEAVAGPGTWPSTAAAKVTYPFTSATYYSADHPGEFGWEGPDDPTNVYYHAAYHCHLGVNAIRMGAHELVLLMPYSGRIWLNRDIFSEIPVGNEVTQRNAWWRAIDASVSARFLVAWCVALYYEAGLHRMRNPERLPGWHRMIGFRAQTAIHRTTVEGWSDILQGVVALLAPQDRLWRQLQEVTSLAPGDHHWRVKVARAGYHLDDVVQLLAERNLCPSALIKRSLDGNQRLRHFEEYEALCDDLLEDMPRIRFLRMQIARHVATANVSPLGSGGGGTGRTAMSAARPVPLNQYGRPGGGVAIGALNGSAARAAVLTDPRLAERYWVLHL